MNRYTDYATYLSRHFNGKVQKLTVDAGFTCPNRDGSKGRGGCAYCNNASFSPSLQGNAKSVTEQLAAGKDFFACKYPTMRYLAYFQSYTNTYGDVGRLMALYREALSVPDVVGLIIGTRPDMMPDRLLEELAGLAQEGRYIMIEYGAESCHDETLERVNRCHTWDDTVDAVNRTHDAGLHVGLHLIMGLPGESRDMMLETVRRSCQLPVDVLKLHQLQILRGTRLALEADRIRTFTVSDYIDLCADIVRIVPRSIAIERFTSSAPAELLIAPRWGLKNYQFVNLLKKRLEEVYEDTVCK